MSESNEEHTERLVTRIEDSYIKDQVFQTTVDIDRLRASLGDITCNLPNPDDLLEDYHELPGLEPDVQTALVDLYLNPAFGKLYKLAQLAVYKRQLDLVNGVQTKESEKESRRILDAQMDLLPDHPSDARAMNIIRDASKRIEKSSKDV